MSLNPPLPPVHRCIVEGEPINQSGGSLVSTLVKSSQIWQADATKERPQFKSPAKLDFTCGGSQFFLKKNISAVLFFSSFGSKKLGDFENNKRGSK